MSAAFDDTRHRVETEPPPGEAAGLLTIDLDALAANWRFLRARADGAECAAVIKADGYGIGLEPAARALSSAGCRTFFVAHLSEGARARAACPDATIYVLNGLPPGAAPTYAVQSLRPILGSREEIEEWAGFCRTAGRLPAAIHIDTGMNRLGFRVEEAVALRDSAVLRAFEPALLMSHFVSSEVADVPRNAQQIGAFQGCTRSLSVSPRLALQFVRHFFAARAFL